MANFAKGQRLFIAGDSTAALPIFRGTALPTATRAGTHLRGPDPTAQGHPDAAIPELREALVIDPSLARAHMGLAVAIAALGKNAEARGEFEETLRYEPSNAEAHYDLGLILADEGDNQAALPHFDTAVSLNPKFGAAYVARSMTLFALGKYREASIALQSAKSANADINPDYAAAVAASQRK